MNRRFRSTFGGHVLKNKGHSGNTTTSNDAATQPTRRARFKPKVGIVTRPPGKPLSQETTISADTIDEKATSTLTTTSIVCNSVDNQVTGDARTTAVNIDSDQPSVNTNKNTTTTIVENQRSVRDKTSTVSVNGNVNDNQSSTAVHQSTNSGTKTAPVNRNSVDQLSTSTKTATLPVGKNVGGLPSSLSNDSKVQLVNKNVDDQKSTTGADRNTVTTKSGCQPSVSVTEATTVSYRATSSQINIAGNPATSSQPVRRARIRPMVGIAKVQAQRPLPSTASHGRSSEKSTISTADQPSSNTGSEALRSASIQIENVNTIGSDKSTSLQDSSSVVSLPSSDSTTKGRLKISEKSRSNVDQPLRDANESSENADSVSSEKTASLRDSRTTNNQPLTESNTELIQHISENNTITESTTNSEKSKSIGISAPTKLTRRARFKPRPVTIASREASMTAPRTQAKDTVFSQSRYDLLEDVVILAHGNENANANNDLPSQQLASCVPVLMEDRSIVQPGDILRGELPQTSSRLGDENTSDLLPQLNTVVMDSDFPNFYQHESAEDLLQTILNTQNHSSSSVPRMVSEDRRDANAEERNDAAKSLVSSSPSITLENKSEVSSSSNPVEARINEATASLQKGCNVNEMRTPVQNREQGSNVERTKNAVQTTRPAATSRLVVKRQRSKPKSKQRPKSIEAPVFDISAIPIATNIEIEPEVSTSEGIDHPVLELPNDLIQDDATQSSTKTSISSGGLKKRFEQKRSGAVKVVLSRRRSQNVKETYESSTVVDKSSMSMDEDSAVCDCSGTTVNRRSTTVDSSIITGNTTSTPGANASTSVESNEQEKSTNESKTVAGQSSELETQSRNEGAKSLDPPTSTQGKKISTNVENSKTFENESSMLGGGEHDLSVQLDVEVENNESQTTNNVQNNNVMRESSSVLPNLEECGLNSDAVLESATGMLNTSGVTSGVLLEFDLRSDEAETSHKVQDNTKLLQGANYIECGAVDTNVQDLSTDSQVEIVLELIDTAQGFANIVCESANAVSSSDILRQNRSTEPSQNNGRVNTVSGSEVSEPLLTSTGTSLSIPERSIQTNLVESVSENSLTDTSKNLVPNSLISFNEIPESVIDSSICARSDVNSMQNTIPDADSILIGGTENGSSLIHDTTLSIPESDIETAIHSTNEQLSDLSECPECSEVMLCVVNADSSTTNELAKKAPKKTLLGTLEHNVARATRRASGVFSEDEVNSGGLRIQASGNGVHPGELEVDASSVVGKEAISSTSEIVSEKENEGKSSKSKQNCKTTMQKKRKASGSKEPSCSKEPTTQERDGRRDTSGIELQDGSLGETDGHLDTSLESGIDSITEVPTDPVLNDASSKKSRKRQSKAIKPKIPPKRTRKKATTVAQESETPVASGENEQENIEAPEGDGSSATTTTTTVQGSTGEEAPSTQKRKRGPAKKSKKSKEASKETESAQVKANPSKKRRGKGGNASSQQLDAVVNIATMRICDMITYNPMTNPMTSENEDGPQTSFLGGISSQNGQSETILPVNEDQPQENADGEERGDVCAPRVTIDADGNIVLDEESLVVQATAVPENLDREVVFENANQQYNAAHKRKNFDRWNKEETLYFYEVLSQIGTDFSLMAKLFPKRNRTELKKKFKREEKINRDLIDKALRQRVPLAASLFADCLEETEEEMERALVVQTAGTETAAQA